MKRIIKVLLIIVGISFCNIVFAENSIDYKFTIVDKNSFREEIKYTITNYEQPENGLSESLEVLEYDMPVFLNGNTNYEKSSYLEGDTYYVNLSYTYNKGNIKNARFINTCFSNHNFTNDTDVLSFYGDEDFLCNMFDNLKITIVSDDKPSYNNADEVNGNEYIWKPNSSRFSIDIKFGEEENTSSGSITSTETKNSRNAITIAYIIIAIVLGGAGLIVVGINNKKNGM